MSSLVIIPTHEEKDNIGPLAEQVLAVDARISILIVDDASTDGTRDEIARLKDTWPKRVFSLYRDQRLGLGSAFLAGFRWALARKFDWIVQMDADSAHDPEDLAAMLKLLPEYALVVGSRYVPGGSSGDLQSWRKLFSRTACLLARSVLGVPIRDITAGFNGWHADALGRLLDRHHTHGSGFGFQIELKHLACREKLAFTEMPIHFHARKAGRSKLRLADIWESLRLLARYGYGRSRK